MEHELNKIINEFEGKNIKRNWYIEKEFVMCS